MAVVIFVEAVITILSEYGLTISLAAVATAIATWWLTTGKDLIDTEAITAGITQAASNTLAAAGLAGDELEAELAKVKKGISRLYAKLKELQGAAAPPPTGWGPKLAAFFDGMAKWITGVVASFFIGFGVKIIQMVLMRWSLWMVAGIARLSKPTAHYVFTKVIETWKEPGSAWGGFVADYLEQMTGGRIDLEGISKAGVIGGTHDAAVALGHTFLEPMLGLIMPSKKESETEPMRGAEAFMSANLQFQMSAWLLHLYGDAVSFGMFKSLKDLPNAISWSYGIGWLSWMVMGPIFRAGITAPMEKKFAEYYRQQPLANAQIIDAYYAGLKDADTSNKELAQSGLSDNDIVILKQLSRKRLPQAIMEYLVRLGFKSKSQLMQYYKDQSYTEEDAEVMVEQLLNKRKRELIDKIVTKMESLFKAGKITEAELRGYYVDANYDQEEQDLSIVALSVDATQVGALSDSEICRLYQNGKMPLEEAKRRLLTRYTDPDDVRLLLELYPPKATAEELVTPRELTPTEIGRLYNLGKIDYEDALKKLTTRTPPVANADLFLLLYERGDEPGAAELLKGLTPAQVGHLYQEGVIPEEEAIRRLVAMNYPKGEALYFLTLYVPVPEKALPTPPKLSAAQVGRLYSEGKLTKEAASGRLMDYFKDANEVALFLELYPVKVPALPPVLPVLTPSQVGRLWQTGELHFPEVIDRLYNVFGDYEEVRLFRLLYPSSIAKEVVGTWYQTQSINRDEAEARLYDLNMTEDEITVWLALYLIS